MKKLGIIIAQEEEASPLLERFKENLLFILDNENYDISVDISGVGKLNAMSLAYEMILVDDVDVILNIGVSAGRGNLRVGDIVSVNRVYDGEFDISVFDHNKYYVPSVGDFIEVNEQGIDLGVRSVPCFTISRFLEGDIDTDIEDYVVDMEYYGIAYVGLKKSIPTYSIKIISDTVKENAHIEYEENLDRCSNLLADYVIELLKSTLVQ